MDQKAVLNYYSNERVLEQMIGYAREREISVALREGGHMSRPNAIAYQRDVLEMVKRGAVSFHGTVERWSSPLSIRTGMTPEQLNGLRNGWDVIIDIDSAIGLDASKLAALRVLDFLRTHGVDAGVKFSGNRGFHIGVPWSSLPKEVDYEPSSSQFPKLPRIVATYVKESIKDDLFNDLKRLKGSVHELLEELGENGASTLTPYLFVDIENNWGERHLFRLPYSLNEKSWLVSLPLSREELESFKPEQAKPGRALKYRPQAFLPDGGSAASLVAEAVDWHAKHAKVETRVAVKRARTSREIPEAAFPPCIKLILNGLADGRKRSILVLVNFLQAMNWPWEKIETAVREANAKNKPPLSDTYVNGQLSWFRRANEAGRSLLPPNCLNDAFYRSYNICKPDETCTKGTNEIKIKNPVLYATTKPIKRQTGVR